MKKIMIVDDEPDQVFTIKTVLENFREDFEIISAKNGMECIQKLKENEIPELIILDIMMPEMSGWEVLKIIRENNEWKHIPVVLNTWGNLQSKQLLWTSLQERKLKGHYAS